VRNAQPWLTHSLATLGRQTMPDFEVIAIDDGSTDASGAVLEAHAARDSRVGVLRTPGIGLPAALNLGFAHARAPYIARMDADDLISRHRFGLQHAHLEAHPEWAVAGSRVRLFPHREVGVGMGRWIRWHNALLDHESIAREMLIDSSLVHGTAMIRREWLERVGGWTNEDWPEDLDLWIRLLDAGARFCKLPQTLYGWRQHAASATRTDERYRLERFVRLKLDALGRWLRPDQRPPTVIGVGRSLERWQAALRARWPETNAIETRSPAHDLLARIAPPIVLVLVAYQRRDLWRSAMTRHGFVESRDFIFVA
jgi:glycosyltransferase involved in cell wall biosynthesis